ncbi:MULTISPECIES: hypothetical protein [unclassified Sphingomonas]|uniref:hypothetical protein n=1 Tax=unclassified Sphingomonas TaxID=196159 RepID=UPI0012E3F7E7|nr:MULTISPECIES: hypothetical protein [unclassified Sphingomonas]
MADEARTGMSSRRWVFGLGFVAAGLGVMSSGVRADDSIQIVMGGLLALASLIATVLLFLKR